MTTEMLPSEVLMKLDERQAVLLDVRTPVEFESIRAESALNVPLDQISKDSVCRKLDCELDANLFVICKSGGRSSSACKKLKALGFSNVINVAGGTDAWVDNGLPVIRGERRAISLDRQVRITAGSIVLAGIALALLTGNIWWTLLSAFIGAGFVFSGVTDTCGMGLILSKMPWNQVPKAACETG